MDPIIWSILLIALAFGVIVLELFVPSAGLLGVLAAVLIVSGIIVAFLSSVQAGVTVLATTALTLPLLIIFLLKLWPNTPIGRKVLIGTLNEDDVLPRDEHYQRLQSLQGKTGIAKSMMLPSGMVAIDGKSYDAISDGFAIEPGEPVQVIAIRTNKVVVRKVDPAELAVSSSGDSDDLLSQPIDQLGIDPIEEN